MIRLTTIVIGSVMLIAGCGQGGFELADPLDAAETDSNVGTSEAKSQIVRALLEAIDEIKGESPEVKDELRRSLLAADDDLAQLLGDSGKQLILNANKKPAATILGKRADPSAKSEAAEAAEKPPVGKRGSPRVSVQRLSPNPADDQSDEPKTSIIKALLKALNESEGDDDDAGNELRTTLIEADKQLRQVLGGQSKRLIEAANRKPPVLRIGPRSKAARSEKASATAPKDPAPSLKPAAKEPSDPSGVPKTKIVEALIEAIEQIDEEDADTRHRIKQSLLQADLELSRILGDKSKRKIQQAAKKPLVPIIRKEARPPEKESVKKERPEKK